MIVVEEKEYFDMIETCYRLQISSATLLSWRKNNKIPKPFVFGRKNYYSNDEIEEYAQKIQQRIEDSKSGFTISQGYANIIPQIQMKQWDYLTKADEMLYQVKKRDGDNFQLYRR